MIAQKPVSSVTDTIPEAEHEPDREPAERGHHERKSGR